ncbi:DoxX family membrane protein [Paractinoplanes brasiliensis]|uniref:Thiosulfate dehydrogenase [quinone] large subunit n=1 Tax=Paractinoplanes brasiliensis TaxID=52695 RepID=A0A4R6JKS0_9ACTN|nr:DoxX family membrane protein [Actinoplanes brasiliensis]TDO36689.1 thiosulfate dehydrogenase [quinone] large subunit [Actinoplanes brasiliensis]GID32327.1 membrane protein [Actinoplanes brasiliensis]
MTTIGRGSAAHLEKVEAPGSMLTHTAARMLAVLRIATGFVFLWAFFDKTFGWGFATPSARAWINGGSPTKGFLSNVEVGPFDGFFRGIAGDAWADWLFMLGLLAIGVAFVLGIGLRIAAVAGAVMMALMWAAEWPPDKTTTGGEPSGSTNPIVDYHVVYGLAGIVLALTYAGHTWGLGKWWASLPFVQKNRWLI